MRKKLLRLLRIAPLGLLLASSALAQTTGTIIGVVTDASTGKPVEGAVVIATSPNLQGEQTAVTGKDGSYRIPLLPSGQYRLMVQIAGYKPADRSDIRVNIDKTLRANMAVIPEAVQLEEQVVRSTVAPVINVGTAESGAVVSREFMSSVPVARGFEAIASVAPTAKLDTYGISFAGAQSPENQYIIDGMNATDATFGTRAGGANGPPALRSDFLQEVDIKTGGFSAEYGRATGGILNVVLKGGSNEFHGSAFSNFTPDMWIAPNGKAAGAAGQAIAYRTYPSKGSYGLDFGAELGGPIMKDRLWFYAGFAPVVTRTYYERFLRKNVLPDGAGNCPSGFFNSGGLCADNNTGTILQDRLSGTESYSLGKRTTYQWVGKLTYLVNENNNVTFSTWGAPQTRTNLGTGFFGGAMYTAPSNRLQDTNDSQMAFIAKYSGKYLDKRLIGEVTGGWFRGTNTPKNRTDAGVNQFNTPKLEWLNTHDIREFEPAAGCASIDECPVADYMTGGRGGNFDWSTNRYAVKGTLGYLFQALGSHNLRGGIDLERLDYDISKQYTGNSYFIEVGSQFRAFRGFGFIRNPTILADGTIATDNAADVGPLTPSNRSQTDSFAYFLQDSWQFKSVTLNAGLRLETQSMKNLDFKDSTGFKINDNWSPRLQAIWDFTGTGRGKAAASWGRFYYAMPLDMGDRAFGSEISLTYRVAASTCPTYATTVGAGNAAAFDPRNISYSTCSVVNRGVNSDFRLTGAPLTPADSGLKGQYVDQFGAQVEYEVLSDLSVALDYQGRRQGNVIEDMSSNDGASYFIGNPGRNRNIPDPNSPSGFSNSSGVDTVDPATGRPVRIAFPKPERSYDALTFRVTKNFSRNWLAQASYTYSSLRGNYPGPFRPEDGQLDPGITSEYDLASLMSNKKGLLPGDQTHVLKLFGAYTYRLNPRLALTGSGAYTGESGFPVNALGAHPLYGSSQSFIIPRGKGGRSEFTNTVDLGGSVEYVVRAPYTVKFRVDVFNVFNSQVATDLDPDYTFDTVVPIAGATCGKGNSAGKANPIAAVQEDCPDLKYLRTTDGRPPVLNVNWGKSNRTTTAFQAPLSLRLGLAVTF